MKKVVISHLTALKDKYKEGHFEVLAGLEALKEADAARGITTRVIHLDQEIVREFGAAPSSRAGQLHNLHNFEQQREAKDAVDRIASSLAPDYIVLLDGPDVVPHVTLDNPNADNDNFEEDTFGSDLPYASSTSYSRKVSDYLNITRVVSRIPNVPGRDLDPQPVVRCLKTTAKFEPRPLGQYLNHFALSAPEFQGATKTSLRTIFGNVSDMDVVPPAGPSTVHKRFSRPTHFINCHGVPNTPEFYGGGGADGGLAVAMKSQQVATENAEEILAISECCFGAELYSKSIQPLAPICISYLANGALGFIGSVNTAYGGTDSGSQSYGRADHFLVLFARHVLAGASLGLSLAKARQEFIDKHPTSDPGNLKTLAQFLLFGDPSTTPCASARPLDEPNFLEQLTKDGEAIAQGKWIPSGELTSLPEAVKEKVRSFAKLRGYLPTVENKETIFKCKRWGSEQAGAAEESQVFVMTISSKAEPLAIKGRERLDRRRYIVAYVVKDEIVDID
jgi:hypothetical protein